MKSQQQAEREEQQRIKNLVLNYDLQQNEDEESMLKVHRICLILFANLTHS